MKKHLIFRKDESVRGIEFDVSNTKGEFLGVITYNNDWEEFVWRHEDVDMSVGCLYELAKFIEKIEFEQEQEKEAQLAKHPPKSSEEARA